MRCVQPLLLLLLELVFGHLGSKGGKSLRGTSVRGIVSSRVFCSSIHVAYSQRWGLGGEECFHIGFNIIAVGRTLLAVILPIEHSESVGTCCRRRQQRTHNRLFCIDALTTGRSYSTCQYNQIHAEHFRHGPCKVRSPHFFIRQALFRSPQLGDGCRQLHLHLLSLPRRCFGCII